MGPFAESKILPTLLLVVLLAAGGFYLSHQGVLAFSLSQPLDYISDLLSSKTSFSDSTLPYRFDYPKRWFAYPSYKVGGSVKSYLAILSEDRDSFSSGTSTAFGPVPKEKLKAEIYEVDNPDNLPLEEWIKRTDGFSGVDPSMISDQTTIAIPAPIQIEPDATQAGPSQLQPTEPITGIRRTFHRGAMSGVEVFFPLNGRIYVLCAYPADSLFMDKFDELLKSFMLKRIAR